MAEHIADRAIRHLKQEIGAEGLERYKMIDDLVKKHVNDYYERHNADPTKWPYGERERMDREAEGLVDTLTPPHLRKAFDTLYELEATGRSQDPATTERALRQQYPEFVARMERGEVKRTEEPRPNTPQTNTVTPIPAKNIQVAQPTVNVQVQKPIEVKPPKTTVVAGPSYLRQRERQLTPFEKAVATQRDKWEKEGLFTPPSMQEIAKQRMAQMQEQKQEEPVSMAEEANPTVRGK